MKTTLMQTGLVLALFSTIAYAEVQIPFESPNGEQIHSLGEVRSIALSPDGSRFASASVLGVFLWDAETEEIDYWIQHESTVRHMIFTPGDDALLTAAEDGYIRVFDASDGQRLREWLAHPGGVSAMELSLDGDVLVTGGNNDNRVIWWDYKTGQSFRNDNILSFPEDRLGGPFVSGPVRWLSLNTSATELLIRTNNIARLPIDATAPVETHWDGGGEYIDDQHWITHNNIAAQIRSSTGIRPLFSIRLNIRSSSREFLHLSPDRKTLVILGALDDRMVERNFIHSEERRGFSFNLFFARHVSFSADGRLMLAVQEDQTITRFLVDGDILNTLNTYRGHTGPIHDIEIYRPQGSPAEIPQLVFAHGPHDSLLRRMDSDTGEQFIPPRTENSSGNRFADYNLFLNQVAVVSGGEGNPLQNDYVIGTDPSFSESSRVSGRNLVFESVVNDFFIPAQVRNAHGLSHALQYSFTAVSGQQVPGLEGWYALGSQSGDIVFVNVNDSSTNGFRILETLHNDPIQRMRFSQDGQRLYSIDKRGRVSIVDWQTPQTELLLQLPHNSVTGITVHPEDTALVISDRNATVIYSMQSVQGLSVMKTIEERRAVAAFTSDGNHLVIASPSGTLQILNTQTWDTVHSRPGHPNVSAMAILPDERIVTGGAQGVIRFWNLSEHTPVRAWRLHQN